jgi:glycosyltransferase involved in cell wall biosynthesis
MQILLLSRYSRMGPSSRYRFYQYVPVLQAQGCAVTPAPLLDDIYIQRLYAGQPMPWRHVLRAYGQRVAHLFGSRRYDLLWLEAEALPWAPAWMEALLLTAGIPYVVDYDDALFHRYDQHHAGVVRRLLGKKIDRVMRRAALVTVGNDYLAERACRAGATRVEILPTVIDLHKYAVTPQPHNDVFSIGWIGSRSTAMHLKTIQPALRAICQSAGVRVIAIGAPACELEGVWFETKRWDEVTEIQELQKFDVGIMPLPDSPWERGKCGFKLIQYMACARPVVGSPVGVNRQIIEDGINGFQATSMTEWIRAFQLLMRDTALRQRMGEAGRVKVEQYYCLQVTAPKLMQLLHEAQTTKEMRYSNYVRH